MSERHSRCRYWPACEIHRGVKPPRKFTDAVAAEMRELRAGGQRIVEIAQLYNTYPATVSMIVHGKTHRRNW